MKTWIERLSEEEAKAQLERADDLLLRLVPFGLDYEDNVAALAIFIAKYQQYVAVILEAATRGERECS